MQLELRAGAVKLAPNQTLRVIDGAGRTVCALDGAVWLTEENDPRDIVLEPGSCYRLRRAGVALLNALSGEASVSFA
jgi:hypothetical protein